MAYDQTPSTSTYQTKKINLFKSINHRNQDELSDGQFLNCFVEIIKPSDGGSEPEYHIIKRPGTGVLRAFGVSDIVRGFWVNEDNQRLYAVVQQSGVTNLYVLNIETGATVSGPYATVMAATGNPVGMCDFLYDNGQIGIVYTNGTNLYVFNTTTLANTQVTDPDLPSPHAASPVFLDGYLFLVKTGTGDIYNSNLNDPAAWTPSNFISAEIEPDQLLDIAKLNNYLVVFGRQSIEYFWDAGNATGSPLQRNDTPVKFNGYIGGLVPFGNQIFYVGTDNDGQPDVFMLEDFNMKSIGNESITRYMRSVNYQTFPTITAAVLGALGHSFYVLNIGLITYVYNIESKNWSQWREASTTTFPVLQSHNVKIFPSTLGPGFGSYYTVSNTVGSMASNTIYKLFSAADNIWTDQGFDYTVSGITENQFFGNNNNKFISRVTAWVDQRTNVSTDTMIFGASTNDGATYFYQPAVHIQEDRCSVNMRGRFRRIQFYWSYSGPSPFRIHGMEVNINMGQN